MEKTIRDAGVALALALEFSTAVAGGALVAASFAIRGEPATLKSVAEEYTPQFTEMSGFYLVDLSVLF